MAYQDVMQRAQAAFQSGKTKNVEFRRRQLESLLRLYEENREEMAAVLAADLRRPKQEAIILEIDFLVNDLFNTLQNLDKWTAVEKVNNYNCKIFLRPKIIYFVFMTARKRSRELNGRSSHLQRPLRHRFGYGCMELSITALFSSFQCSNCCWQRSHSQAERDFCQLCKVHGRKDSEIP